MKHGETIICIDDSLQPHTLVEISNDVPNWIKKGQKYTVREIVDNDFVVGILLEEVANPVKYFKLVNRFQEPAFASWRFRELEESELEESLEKSEDLLVSIEKLN